MTFRNAILIFAAFSLACPNARSQDIREKVKNLPSFEQKNYHFGFTGGLNSADFIMYTDLSGSDSLLILEPQRQTGLNIGIVTSLRLNYFFTLRFVPLLAFGQRNLEYTFQRVNGTREKIVKPVESTWIDSPVYIKYRSERVNNFAAYLLAGGKYSLDLASQHKVENLPGEEIIVKIKPHSFSAEIGFGLDFFLPYFKFSPEFRYSYGINNLIVKDHTIYSDPIQRLFSKIFFVSLNFEG